MSIHTTLYPLEVTKSMTPICHKNTQYRPNITLLMCQKTLSLYTMFSSEIILWHL
jgi:hypothetical protein